MSFEGGCDCRAVRYRMTDAPLFVHCCHCRSCQRETGASFALKAMIEADRVVLLSGDPEIVLTPSNSGKGQKIARCPTCRIALWSNYAGAGDKVRFVRVGTLGSPDRFPPDIHLFTTSKQPGGDPARRESSARILRSQQVLAAAKLRAANGTETPSGCRSCISRSPRRSLLRSQRMLSGGRTKKAKTSFFVTSAIA